MLRRTFLGAAALTLPGAAWAQGLTVARISPENELEAAFVGAVDNPAQRQAFRGILLESRVALALANQASDSPPRMVDVLNPAGSPTPSTPRAAIFTSASRLEGVLGPAIARVMLTGRDALTRLRGRNVVLNYRLLPMLTLDADDVASYLQA